MGGTGAQDGSDADQPTDIPASGWRAIAGRVVGELQRDHVSLLSAGVAFRGLLALFPSMIAAITLWGLVTSPQQVTEQLRTLTDALPLHVAMLLEEQLVQVAQGGTRALSFALGSSLLLALWSASSGTAGLIEGVNVAYNEVDDRGFVMTRGVAVLVTLGAIVFVILTIGLIVVLPALLANIGLGSVATSAIRVGRWPALALLVIAALAGIYKLVPDREDPRLRWVTPGAIIATVLWLVGSALFTLYVEHYGTFGQTYGALAGVIILMLWLMLSAFVVLLGAEVNAEMERQTLRDTTTAGR